jgi:integrase
MGYPEKRGEGKDVYWRGRFKLPEKTKTGKSKYGTLPDKYKTAKAAKKAADVEEEKANAPQGGYTDPRKALTPFGEWAFKWMDKKKKSPRTMERRWFLLDKLLLPQWEFTPIGDITWFEVESWADESPYDDDTTVRQAITLLSQILTGAVDAKMLTVNVARGRRRSKDEAKEKPAPTGRKTGGTNKIFPSAEQAILISRRCANDTDRLMILTATWCGLRYGELCALHRDNVLLERRDRIDGREVLRHVIRIDPEAGELKEYAERIERGRNRTVLRLGSPKSDSSVREVDVPPFLVELLRAYMNERREPYLFTTQSGTFWRRPNWSSQVMRPVCDGSEATPDAPWVSIAHRLIEGIRSGEWKPGDNIPAVKELGADAEVSPATAHRAVAHLATLGIVTAHRGRRTVVTAGALELLPNPSRPAETSAILPGLELHGCRHANKTRMEQGDEYGEIPKTLQNESLGHKYRGIDGIYIHPTPEMRQRRLVLLEKWWQDAQRVLSREAVEDVDSPAEANRAVFSQESPTGS